VTGLRQAALSGARWILIARVGMQLVTWPITIIVMRELEPGDYGVFAIALLVQGFIAMFAELGLGVALVQTPRVSDAQRRMAATLLLLFNAVITALIVLVAPWVARLYDVPEVTAVMWVLSLELVLASVAAVPQAMLERELRFRAISIVQVVAGVSASVVTLAAALADLGVWALVAGALALALIRTLGILIAYGRIVWPGRVELGAIRPMVDVGGHTLAGRLLWYWSGQADSLLLGLQLQASALGAYNTSSQLAMLPAGKAMEAVNRVAFPVLCRLVDRIDEMRLAVNRLRGLLALYGFGVCWALAAVAPEFVLLVLGEKWQAAQGPLAALALVTPLRMLSSLHNMAVTAAGQPVAATRELIVAAALIPSSVAFGAWTGGLTGASLAWLVAYPAVFALSIVLTSAVLQQRRRQAAATLVAPLLAGAALLASVWLCRRLLTDSVALPALLTAEIGVGAAAYLLVIWIGARSLLREARILMLDLVRPGRTA
jgi:O-antigen/teichoic acid export membrane protein